MSFTKQERAFAGKLGLSPAEAQIALKFAQTIGSEFGLPPGSVAVAFRIAAELADRDIIGERSVTETKKQGPYKVVCVTTGVHSYRTAPPHPHKYHWTQTLMVFKGDDVVKMKRIEHKMRAGHTNVYYPTWDTNFVETNVMRGHYAVNNYGPNLIFGGATITLQNGTVIQVDGRDLYCTV